MSENSGVMLRLDSSFKSKAPKKETITVYLSLGSYVNATVKRFLLLYDH